MIATWGLHEKVMKGVLLAGILSAVGFGLPAPSQAANKLVSEEEFSALFASADSSAATTDAPAADMVHKRSLAKVPQPGADSNKREATIYVIFETGTVLLKTPESFTQLDNAGRAFKRSLEAGKNDTWVIEVAGHTDNVGSPQKNLKLSKERAEAIRHYLLQTYGLPPNVVIAKGYGDTQPIVSNDTAEGREQNRRVIFKVTQRTAALQ